MNNQDIEKVRNALKCIADGTYCECCSYGNYHECTKKIAADALELLKDYRSIIECKNCKHGVICKDETGQDIVECMKLYKQMGMDSYCSYGEQ